MPPSLYALLWLVQLAVTLAHVADFPHAPPLNASEGAFNALLLRLDSFYAGLRADAPTWRALDAGNGWGIKFTTTTDGESGCPWIFASADLPNCSIASSARFIVTELETYQARRGHASPATPHARTDTPARTHTRRTRRTRILLPRPPQRRWDKKLLGHKVVRRMPSANASITWFDYNVGSPVLSRRGYYVFGAWRWTGSRE